MGEWGITIAALIGLGLCWIGLELIVRRDKARLAAMHENVIEVLRRAGTEEIGKLRHEAEIEWAMEQSQYEVKH